MTTNNEDQRLCPRSWRGGRPRPPAFDSARVEQGALLPAVFDIVRVRVASVSLQNQSIETCELSEADLNAESWAGFSPMTSELPVKPCSRGQGRIELPLRGSNASVSATNEISGRCESCLLHQRNEMRIVRGHVPVFVCLAPIMPSPLLSSTQA